MPQGAFVACFWAKALLPRGAPGAARPSHSTLSPRPRADSACRSSACASTLRHTPLSLTNSTRAAVRALSLSAASCAQGVERKAVSTNTLLTRSSESAPGLTQRGLVC